MATESWSHRGASAYAPENSLYAFDLAVEMGANGVDSTFMKPRTVGSSSIMTMISNA